MTHRLALLFALAACGHAEDFSMDRPPPSRHVGAACSADSQCDQFCATGPSFPGGFCTIGCLSNPESPEGTVCIAIDGGICLYPCRASADCTSTFLGRSGYRSDFRNGFDTPDTRHVRYDVCIAN
jgi:hypothetical protein